MKNMRQAVLVQQYMSMIKKERNYQNCGKNISLQIVFRKGICVKIHTEIELYMNREEIVAKIKRISLSITECSYDNAIQQGYELLTQLHDLGKEEEIVYQLLFSYYNSLEDGLSRDYMADMMDFVVGWCSPHRYVWKED